MTKEATQNVSSGTAKFFAPLIDFDIAAGLLTEDVSSFGGLLLEAQRIAGCGSEGGPQAAIAWLSDGQGMFGGNRMKIGEMTQPAHGLMLHALLNALPIADISSDQPNVINDTMSRADFENVCPVRFLALFPIASEWIQTVGFLVLYDVKPGALGAGASSALAALAGQIATSTVATHS